jgi:hypothetical protein
MLLELHHPSILSTIPQTCWNFTGFDCCTSSKISSAEPHTEPWWRCSNNIGELSFAAFCFADEKDCSSGGGGGGAASAGGLAFVVGQ